jgi:hypothetical protein
MCLGAFAGSVVWWLCALLLLVLAHYLLVSCTTLGTLELQ